MSNSSLVNYTKISPHSSNPRTNSIKKITIHHMAGNLSVETCGNVFQTRNASANYGIGSDGRVGMYVEENNRSWASSSPPNDHQAVTIEVANDDDEPTWHVSDKALAKLIDLCVDICKRNGIESLNYTGNSSGNLTRHNMFASTTCPGPYLQSKFPYIAEEVNKRLKGTTEPTGELYKVQVGAFSVKQNAENFLKELKEKGYPDAFITSGNQSAINSEKEDNSIKLGDTVKIKQGATDYNGTSLASFVYSRTYTVDSLTADRAVLDKTGFCTAVNVNDLYKV